MSWSINLLYTSEISIWSDSMSPRWFILYVKGSQVRIFKLICTSAKSVDPGEMLRFVLSGSYLFAKVPV